MIRLSNELCGNIPYQAWREARTGMCTCAGGMTARRCGGLAVGFVLARRCIATLFVSRLAPVV